MDYSIEDISTKIINRIENKFQQLIDIICVELAYIVLFFPKYTISHEFDPLWDHSGMLIKLNESFSSKDYACVVDFLDEYTGQSTASFVSGHGYFYVRYEEYFEDMIRDFVFDCYREVLSEIDSEILFELLIKSGYEVSEEEKVNIAQTVIEVELFEEPLWYHHKLLERIQMINFEMMFLRGRDEAWERHETQLRLSKERAERGAVEKEAANTLWDKLEKLYKLQTGSRLLKIEMKDYKEFKEFLDYNQVSREDRILLSQQLGHKFSNHVCLNLCR